MKRIRKAFKDCIPIWLAYLAGGLIFTSKDRWWMAIGGAVLYFVALLIPDWWRWSDKHSSR